MIHPLTSHRRKQSGTSLLEVLIAVLIMAVGMLGMAALQAVTLKNSNSSTARSQAVMQTYSLFDRLRLNRIAAMGGSYNVGWSCTSAADDPDVADDDSTDFSVFNGWLVNLQNELGPGTCGRIQCAADSCTVGVRWDDSRGTGDADTLETLEIETISRL
ncbi:type IV pilus modification protein PilV [Lysobacter sp. A289]